MKIDQWLWAAGFYNNRGLAQAAADGGKVKVGGERVKAAHEITPGDQLEIATGEYMLEVAVLALEAQHGMDGEEPLYEESEDSIARRAQAMEAKKLAATHRRHSEPEQRPHGRPGGGGGSGRAGQQPGQPGRPGRSGHRGKNQRRQSEGFKGGRGR
jgi:ribosome-associated heat shock protein Hsp15